MPALTHRKPDKERMRAAILHQQTDEIPYWEGAICKRNLEFLFEREGMPDLSWALSPEDQVKLAEWTGQDVIPSSGGFLPTARVREKDGSLRYLKEGELTTWELLDRLEPYTEEEIQAAVDRAQRGFDLVAGTGLGVWGCGGAFWQGAWQVVGFDEFMMKTVEDVEFCRRVIEYLAAPQVTAAEMLCERYPFLFYGIGDNIATTKGPFLHPDLFKPLWCPWAEKIFAVARANGIPTFLNTDGRIDWILDDFVAMGVDALNPVDPNGNDIFEVKEKYGDKLCLVGGINQHWPLATGAEQDVKETVRDCIERLRGGGGYVVSSSHDIGDNVPPQNWVAMIRAVEKYG